MPGAAGPGTEAGHPANRDQARRPRVTVPAFSRVTPPGRARSPHFHLQHWNTRASEAEGPHWACRLERLPALTPAAEERAKHRSDEPVLTRADRMPDGVCRPAGLLDRPRRDGVPDGPGRMHGFAYRPRCCPAHRLPDHSAAESHQQRSYPPAVAAPALEVSAGLVSTLSAGSARRLRQPETHQARSQLTWPTPRARKQRAMLWFWTRPRRSDLLDSYRLG
jgi:hypothetical protein